MQITLPKPTKVINEEKNRAVFVFEELYPGFGVTVGNALRRVLYSSLPGAAITQVKIKGVSHEFSTLKGVLEDVLEITLNLKQIYIKLHGDEPQTASIKIKGAQEVKASDIQTPSQVEIINKDSHIATITAKDATFEMEILIEPGFGYLPVEQRQKTAMEIGSIPLDAIFTPIRKVNFEVENMRVADRTDYNRLHVDVTTNGTISPREAMVYAAKLLTQHFQLAGDIEIPKVKPAVKKVVSKKRSAKKNKKSEK